MKNILLTEREEEEKILRFDERREFYHDAISKSTEESINNNETQDIQS